MSNATLESPAPETAADYLNNPEENNRQDMMFVAPPRTFQGQTLAPYGEGIRGVMLNMTGEGDHDNEWLLLLLRVMLDLQGFTDAHRKQYPNLSEDDITTRAARDLMVATADKFGYRAKVFMWRNKLGRSGMREALKLANDIFEQSQSSELQAAEPAEANEPGK